MKLLKTVVALVLVSGFLLLLVKLMTATHDAPPVPSSDADPNADPSAVQPSIVDNPVDPTASAPQQNLTPAVAPASPAVLPTFSYPIKVYDYELGGRTTCNTKNCFIAGKGVTNIETPPLPDCNSVPREKYAPYNQTCVNPTR
jgi:hypothetical protein